jgi:hypothetical protein
LNASLERDGTLDLWRCVLNPPEDARYVQYRQCLVAWMESNLRYVAKAGRGLPGFGLKAAFCLGMITKLPQGICGWLEQQQQMVYVDE